MNIFEEEITEFFKIFNEEKVKFLLVGGAAVNYHGYSRTTGDVDIWVEDSEENRKNLVSALKKLGMEETESFLSHPLIAGYAEIMLDNGIYIDLMSDLQFLKQEQFKDCYTAADSFMLNEKIEVKVLSIKKLIEEKSGSERAKDIEDVQWLKKLLK